MKMEKFSSVLIGYQRKILDLQESDEETVKNLAERIGACHKAEGHLLVIGPEGAGRTSILRLLSATFNKGLDKNFSSYVYAPKTWHGLSSIVDSIISNVGHDVAHKLLQREIKLEGTKYKIAIEILSQFYLRGAGVERTTIISKFSDMATSTLSYHLKDLVNEGILTQQRIGYKVYYFIPKAIRSALQLTILSPSITGGNNIPSTASSSTNKGSASAFSAADIDATSALAKISSNLIPTFQLSR